MWRISSLLASFFFQVIFFIKLTVLIWSVLDGLIDWIKSGVYFQIVNFKIKALTVGCQGFLVLVEDQWAPWGENSWVFLKTLKSWCTQTYIWTHHIYRFPRNVWTHLESDAVWCFDLLGTWDTNWDKFKHGWHMESQSVTHCLQLVVISSSVTVAP